MMEKIPVILVLGFLGSGKTSFVKHILSTGLPYSRPAIVQNDFAPAGIDAEEIRHADATVRILEINGGSVFCACRIDNFIPSLAAFISLHQPDLLLIEASGISDPLSLAEILTAPSLRDALVYSGAVCVADVPRFMALQQINLRVREQVRMADVVLLNKTDLASDEETGAAASMIRELNPACEIMHTSYGQASLNLEDLRNNNGYYLTNRHGPSGGTGLKTAVIRSVLKISRQGLDEFLSQVLPGTLRLKGFVNLADGSVVMVQATGAELTIAGYQGYTGPTQLIAIGSILDARAFSEAFREACAGSTAGSRGSI